MPPRLNKRQLRAQEELLSLQDAATPAEESSDASSPPASPQPTRPVGGFAAVRPFSRRSPSLPDEMLALADGKTRGYG